MTPDGVKFHEGHHLMMPRYFYCPQVEDGFVNTSVQYMSKNILQAKT